MDKLIEAIKRAMLLPRSIQQNLRDKQKEEIIKEKLKTIKKEAKKDS